MSCYVYHCLLYTSRRTQHNQKKKEKSVRRTRQQKKKEESGRRIQQGQLQERRRKKLRGDQEAVHEKEENATSELWRRE